MKNIVILVSLSIFFFGCTKDWGTPATKNYPINGAYTKLDVSNAFDVTVSDQVTDVVVTVGELAHDRVVVRVVDGELQIGFKPNTRYNGKAVAVIPANANLSDLELSGASSFTGDLRGDDVDIELSGASTYLGTIEATELDVDLSGASDAILSGVCKTKMGIDLSGASTLKAANLSAESVYGEMSGASDADVTVCSALNVNLSGASTLTYGTSSEDCHPNVNCPASGSSVVKPRH
ncbi:MAG: DUF2807 domain-containing protein [Bacteroidales bacterium]|nr:DUF2807 domain-containing protein [Bacteroidales bacterium]MDY6347200.1 DUF2807 domain-containing protein [Bacteroidales bacterium]